MTQELRLSDQVCHIRTEGKDWLVVPVSGYFRDLTETEQRAAVARVGHQASEAHLSGTVVFTWEQRLGRIGYTLPAPEYLARETWADVQASLNRRLTAIL
jgi:hypothetical protein